MKKTISVLMLAVMLLLMGGCQKEATIVGKWESSDPSKIINYEFTADHKVIQDQLQSDGSWDHTVSNYELKEGRLIRSNSAEVIESAGNWDEAVPVQIPVIYTIDGDTLVLEAISHLGKTEFHRVDSFSTPNPNTTTAGAAETK
jgi:hypothetical protein